MAKKLTEAPEVWYFYNEIPDAPELRGLPVSVRQIKRQVELGKLAHVKFGNRVAVSGSMLVEWVEKSTRPAVR